MKMDNLLLEWCELSRSKMEELGFGLEIIDDGKLSTCSVVDVTGLSVGGRICHWMPDIFEFQFHDHKSGDVIFLETKRFDSSSCLAEFVETFLSRGPVTPISEA